MFWGWGFGKHIRNVSAKNEEVLTSQDRIEETGAGLVDAVGVRLVQYFNRCRSRQPVTHTARFLTSIEGFYTICPYKKEDSVIFVNLNWLPKHALCIVLVELEELGSLPVAPVVLLD